MKILLTWFTYGLQSVVNRYRKIIKKIFQNSLGKIKFDFQSKFVSMGRKDNEVIDDLRDSFPHLPQNSKTFEIFNVGVIAGNVPIRHVYDVWKKSKALPYRSCHLGSTWNAIDQNYHIGTGVFHLSEYNVLKDGSNVLFFDYNLVPYHAEDGWQGDTLWWPGYTFENGKYKKMDLYYFNPETQELEPTQKDKALLQTYLFLKDGTPLNYYHFQKVKSQGMTQAYTFNKLFSENRSIVRLNIIRLVRKAIRSYHSSTGMALKEISTKVVYPTGEIKRVNFEILDGIITYKGFHWTAIEFAEELSQTMMHSPSLGSFFKRKKMLTKLHKSSLEKPVPFHTKELMILLATLTINQKDENLMIHAHSGGYDMAGAKPYTSGYMFPNSSNKLRRLFKFLGKASDIITQSQFEMYTFQASIFSFGSFLKRDIAVLNRLLSEYIQLTRNLTVSKIEAPEVMKLIKRYSKSLSKEFWLNYKPTNFRKLSKMKGDFTHPSLLFELSFSEASYLVGHLRIFGEKMKG